MGTERGERTARLCTKVRTWASPTRSARPSFEDGSVLKNFWRRSSCLQCLRVFGQCRGFVLGLLLSSGHFAVRWGASPLWPGLHRLDQDDERRARLMRETLGHRLYLVSWEHQPDGLWMARLSGPGLVVTIERIEKSRGRAILRAERAMNRILSCHLLRDPQRPAAANDNSNDINSHDNIK